MEKENMKKVLMILLGAALILSMSGSVFAVDVELTPETSKEHAVDVIYDIGETYKIVLPSEVSLPIEMDIDVLQKRLDSGHYLNIYMKSKNGWRLHLVEDDVEQPGTNITYVGTLFSNSLSEPRRFTNDTAGTDEYLVYSVMSGQSHAANDLYLNIYGDVVTSGMYKDTLTFTVRIQTNDDTLDGAFTGDKFDLDYLKDQLDDLNPGSDDDKVFKPIVATT